MKCLDSLLLCSAFCKTYASIKWKLRHPFPGLLQIVSFKFSSLEAKIVFKCPTQLPDLTSNFSVKGKISDHDCLLIYQALKLRTCITFLPCHSLAKVNSLP